MLDTLFIGGALYALYKLVRWGMNVPKGEHLKDIDFDKGTGHD